MPDDDDENINFDSIIANSNAAVTDTAKEVLGKRHRKRKYFVKSEAYDLCD